MQTRMLNFCKTILEKVSFDHQLLNKEYRKCLNYLDDNERHKLTEWVSFQDFSRRTRVNKNAVKKEHTDF